MKILFGFITISFLISCGDSNSSSQPNTSSDCEEQEPIVDYTTLPANDIFITTAIVIGDSAKLDTLLDGVENIDAVDETGSTLLAQSIMFDNQYAFEKILSKGANPNITDANDFTSLHVALVGNVEDRAFYVERLVEAGISVDYIPPDGLDYIGYAQGDKELEAFILAKCHGE